jgi:hypothetical protein
MLKQKRAMTRPAPKHVFIYERLFSTKTTLIWFKTHCFSFFLTKFLFSPPKVPTQALPLIACPTCCKVYKWIALTPFITYFWLRWLVHGT